MSRASSKALYEKAKATGMCVKCRKAPGPNGLTKCNPCHMRETSTQRVRRGIRNLMRKEQLLKEMTQQMETLI